MLPEKSTIDIRTALKQGMAELRAAAISSHTLAVEVLLMHVLGRDRGWMYSHHDEILDVTTTQEYSALIARRAAGEPTQYLIGHQEFWGLDFEVTPAVLIPRPETEHIIEVALGRLATEEIRQGPLRIADVGTGSGCIAIAR